jgi:Ca2+/Na+ antiporter
VQQCCKKIINFASMLKSINKLDLLGITGSALCLGHCILLPFIFIYNGEHQHHHHDQWFGIDIDYYFLLVAAFAVILTSKKPGPIWIKIALWASLLACFVGIAMHDVLPVLKYVLYLGSLGLITSHIFNMRHCSHA